MATKIRSISLSEEDDKFVSELNLSPTALIKSKIDEIRETSKISLELLKEMERQRDTWHKNFEKAVEFLKNKELYNEFFEIQ
jgi:hypothetical protein